ncbi:acyl-CoA thioester hydrolase/BAAT C-terminal domain-containing protein [Microbacterium sp. NPDC055903]
MHAIAATDRYEALPDAEAPTGILVLAGSSGRVETERADLLARHGVRAHAIRWFGGEGQRPVPHEVPIEAFFAELDRLREMCDRVAILGTSFGAEAALLTASLAVTDAAIAIAPTSVVWPGIHEGQWSSHWTIAGEPVPWVPFVSDWVAETDPPEFRQLYARSLAADTETSARAAIPVERIGGELLLVAGGDDRVWPSVTFTERIVARRAAAGLDTNVRTHPDAGHRVPFPGERVPTGGQRMARGGDPTADAELGASAFDALLRILGADGRRAG